MTTAAALKNTNFMATFAADSARARKYGTCAMCPETRKLVVKDGKTYVYCPRCGDAVEISTK